MKKQFIPKKSKENVISKFQNRLLKWYEKNKRNLPWRSTKDPYHILVSEVMLQQTQTFRVKDYYKRFIADFPDIETLAHSKLPVVLKTWEGLGYYARARNLHRTAKLIANHRQGQFPQTYEDLIALPGVGSYTAAAIMSIAYNKPFPVVDGNVTRLISRVFGIDADPKEADTKRKLSEIINEFMPRRRAGLFNQALMELGSLVCQPKNPQCGNCCLKTLCYARTLPDPTELPIKAQKKPRPHYDVTAGFIWNDRKLLLAQRPIKEMLGGLWEFPGGKRKPNESLQACLRREIREELGIHIEVKKPIASVKHGYSHFRITLHGFHCKYIRGQVQSLGCADWKWVSPSRVSSFALPGADRKLFETWKTMKET
ncbi:MAG: A/G-specific adenine glycosylase [Gemmatimonadota bacterium]|nr:MAG: A/G-specific adenine glycosylase [Gemmatimonadota bacterium]